MGYITNSTRRYKEQKKHLIDVFKEQVFYIVPRKVNP
jgi:hypothetical protein